MKSFFNKEWHERTKKLTFHDLLRLHRRFNEFEIYETDMPENSHILDVGVGLGFETAHYLDRGYKVEVTDCDGEIIRLLNKRCESYSHNLETYKLPLPFKDDTLMNNKYDLVIVSNVLHYLTSSEVKKAISQLQKLLTETGYIIIRVHSKQHIYNFDKSKKKKYKSFFDLKELESFFPNTKYSQIFASEYFREYTSEECNLYGYPIGRSKNSITVIYKKEES